MIITKKKPIADIIGYLKDSKNIFLIGCAQCATVCKTGGEEQVAEMEIYLKCKGKIIVGKTVLDPACNLTKVKQFFYQNKEAIGRADTILSLACGNGTQVIKDGNISKTVVPGIDTLFLGETERGGRFSQKCLLCGDCIIHDTDSICPITACSKGLLNGPCGGQKNGKCEVDRERDCGWLLIYKRLKEKGRVCDMEKIVKPRDYSIQINPQNFTIDNTVREK
jgi:ferredoxin